MRVETFIADSAAEAVEQIKHALGPEAVVLNVRRISAQGLKKLWGGARVEVTAGLSEQSASEETSTSEALAEVRSELADLRAMLGSRSAAVPGSSPGAYVNGGQELEGNTRYDYKVGTLLEKAGMLPAYVHRVLDLIRSQEGAGTSADLRAELDAARQALISVWTTADTSKSGFHVFIGPPGSGKTTVLCKWLAQTVLVNGSQAAVWRLDTQVANTAESLSVFGQILGVPVMRHEPGTWPDDSELSFIDLPGTDSSNPEALRELSKLLSRLPKATVHLVLNGAYENSLLLSQARAFGSLPVSDVIVTHLDEEQRWGKLWNLMFGTNFTISFLSAGQNIPGSFERASPDKILGRFFPRN